MVGILYYVFIMYQHTVMACLTGEDTFGTEGLLLGCGGSAGFFFGSNFGSVLLGSCTGALFGPRVVSWPLSACDFCCNAHT